MQNKLMILPASEAKNIRLVRIPDDFEEHEAYRYVTALIAEIEENTKHSQQDIDDLLEDRSFEIVDFILGPAHN